jgi:hypothetical protein
MKFSVSSSVRTAKQTRWALFAAIALACNVLVRSAPIAYTLTVLAKTGDTIGRKTLTGFKLPSFGANSPAINAGGTVAFYATYSEGAFVGEGIFTQASLLLKTGDAVRGQTLDGIGFVPALNDSGTVAVRGLQSSRGSVILSSSTVLSKVGNTIGGQTLDDFGPPAINNKGGVAFVASFSGGTGIFTQTALLAKSGQSIAGQKLERFSPPAINDDGMVAFQSWLSGRSATAILTPTSVLVKAGDTIAGKTLTNLFFGSALNSSGTVAFIGVFPGGTGIFTQNALLVQAGESIGGLTLSTFGYPVINQSGVVAFFATYPGGMGVFTQTSLIAKTGDTICGKTLIGLGQPAINSGGTVAFAASFSDGSSAIILARPTMVPTHVSPGWSDEPSSCEPGANGEASHEGTPSRQRVWRCF